MKVQNLTNLKPAQLQPIWKVEGGKTVKQYRCLAGPNKGSVINNPRDYFKTSTVEIDNEDS